MKKIKTKIPPLGSRWRGYFEKIGPGVLVLFLGCLGMWQFHNSEFYSGFDLVPGGRGDPRLVTALLEYFHRSLHGSGKLDSPAFYYPVQGALGYADVFLTYTVLYEGLRQMGSDIFSALQACVFTTDALNYLCCFLFLWKGLGLRAASAGLGAFFFAFNAPKFNQISHVQLQCLFWLPLFFWCLAEWVKREKTMKPLKSFGLLALAAGLFNIQLLSSFYPSWFCLFWFGLFFGAAFFFSPARLFLKDLLERNLFPLLGAAAFFLAGLVPFLLIYLPVIRELGGKSYDEVKMMIPSFWSYFWMGPRHGWWGWIWDACPSIQAFPVEVEVRLGFGLGMMMVWGGLIWGAVGTLRKKGAGIHPRMGALAVLTTALFFLLAFQYTTDFSPWRWVYEWVPGAGSIRAVSRMVLFLALPMSAAAAYAFDEIWKGAGKKTGRGLRAASLILAGIIVGEQTALPPYPAFSKKFELSRLEYLGLKLPDHCGAFFATLIPTLPYSATDIQIDAMLVSALKGIPTLNGYSGQSPPQWGLYKVRSPKYGEYVRDWIALHRIQGNVGELKVDH